MKLRKMIGSTAIAALMITGLPVGAQQTGPSNTPTGQGPTNNPNDDDGGLGTGEIIGIGAGILGLIVGAKLLMKDKKEKPFTKKTVVLLYQGDEASARSFAETQGLRDTDIEYLDSVELTMIAARSAKKEKPVGTVTRLTGMTGVVEIVREGRFQQMGNTSGPLIPASSAAAPIAMTAMAAAGGSGVNVAMIDSLVDINHASLKSSWIKQQNFTGKATRSAHGTAIASLIVGKGKVTGKARSARLHSLAAFAPSKSNKPGISRTRSLARALNAAARINPHILNMSFGGPNDAVLARILRKIASRGTCMVAATGNGGKKASPPFPARLSQVAGITAVDKKMRAYKYATPGFHVGAAASGVKRLTAVPGGYRISSGTSFATADVAGQLARSSLCSRRRGKGLNGHISKRARDLGKPGRDDVYGHGLFRL